MSEKLTKGQRQALSDYASDAGYIRGDNTVLTWHKQRVMLAFEATIADLERQLADFVKANNEVGHRCADLEIELVAARKRIVELEQRLPPDSAGGLGNELKAWDAASDEALARFEEGLESRTMGLPSGQEE